MAPNATPGSRKRGRPRNDDPNKDASTKKPRLNSSAASKRATPGSLRSLSAAISGSFGHGERKVSTNGALKKGRQLVDKTWEIPDSDDDAHPAKGKKVNRTTNSSTKASNSDISGVYDFHGSDEEPSPVHTPSRKTRGAAPAGQTSSKAAKSASVATRQNDLQSKSEPSSWGTTRGNRGAAIGANRRKACNEQDTAEATVSETERGEAQDASDFEDVLTPAAVRPTASHKGAFPTTNGDTPKLKGILTPSRRFSERNAKSVAFDEPKGKPDEIYFADLPNKMVKSKPSPQKRPIGNEHRSTKNADGSDEGADESDENEGDDEVCVVCSKPDSKPPNEILFCDSCDLAVHQKCSGVSKIPKGDWLCKNCAQNPTSGSGVMDKISVMAAEAVPGIPNFEQHLRSLQRVLFDRCTGKRRIKLRDQDEAYEKTYQLVEQTVLAGEGNSMLIIGARGCGKTTVSVREPSSFQPQILTSESRWWTWYCLILAWTIRTTFMLYD